MGYTQGAGKATALRNRAPSAARRARAVELRTAGLTYQAIAEELGYKNRAQIAMARAPVHHALKGAEPR